MHMPPLLSQIENHEVEATRAATTAKGYFSARTVRSDRYRLLNMPVATCPRIIPLSRGRALWARAWPRKYFLYTFLSPSPLSSLSLFPFTSIPLLTFAAGIFVEPKFPRSLDLVCINYPSVVFRLARNCGCTRTRIHPRVHPHYHALERWSNSYPFIVPDIYQIYIYRYVYVWYIYMYISDIYRIISILLSEQCICLWRRKVFDKRRRGTERGGRRVRAWA